MAYTGEDIKPQLAGHLDLIEGRLAWARTMLADLQGDVAVFKAVFTGDLEAVYIDPILPGDKLSAWLKRNGFTYIRTHQQHDEWISPKHPFKIIIPNYGDRLPYKW